MIEWRSNEQNLRHGVHFGAIARAVHRVAQTNSHFDIMKQIAADRPVVVFEDEHVVAYEIDDDDREEIMDVGERRITIAPRKPVVSLLDIGVADAQLSAHMLVALQQVAYKLNLHRTGFEVRFNVLPPYQRRPHLSLHIRTGKASTATSS
jgi:hypothetical protein